MHPMSFAGVTGPLSRRSDRYPGSSHWRFTATVVMSVLLGCTNDPAGPGGGGAIEHRSALFVNGSVVEPGGAGLYDSLVRVTVFEFQTACSAQPIGAAFEGRTNEIGQYSLNLTFDRDEFDACLTIEAIPPTGSGLQSAVSHATDVEVNKVADGIGAVQFDFQLTEATALQSQRRE